MLPMALAKKAGMSDIVDEAGGQFRLIQHTEFVAACMQGDEPTTGPGDDEGLGVGVEDLLHVGREVGRVGRGEDVVGHELAAKQGAGITEGLRAAVAKGVVRGDLDEGVVLLR